MTQTQDVLDLLRHRGEAGITALDALQAVGTLRLAARIADLRDEGYAIETEMISLSNGKRVARYRLDEPGVLVQQNLAL